MTLSYSNFNWRAPALIVGGLLLIGVISYVIIDVAYAGRVMPGIAIGSSDLSGHNIGDAQAIAEGLLDEAQSRRIVLVGPDSSVSYELEEAGLLIDREATLLAIETLGRGPNPFKNLWQRLSGLLGSLRSPVAYELTGDWSLVIDLIEKEFGQIAVDAGISVKDSQAFAEPARAGLVLATASLTNTIHKRVRSLDLSPMELPLNRYPPRVTTEMAEATASRLNHSLNAGYTLKALGEDYEISPDLLWGAVQVLPNGGSFIVKLNDDKIAEYFESLEQQVNQPMQNAILVMEADRVKEFKPHQRGAVLRTNEAVQLIQSTLLSDERELDLPINYLEPKTKLADLNDLGINELVAQGVSNFSGSPANRRHNIRIGASRFDGVLVPPQNTFSFNQALGRVDASTGYLPELVIKQDETIPEYGGGLCQVSTTAFRAILNGGYPVVARKNHSYRVAYYEPAGSDATIYPPYPDLKFTNDSPGYILMQTRIEGDNLYFDFYGTSMPREVELDGPHIYNVTNYPEPVYIETSTIPAGEVRQIDSAHRGADAVLYRYVYDQNGREMRKDTFNSHYIPWPAKYLVGVEEAPEVDADLKNVPPEDVASEEPVVELTPEE